ncbi:hypothetical protein ACP70R_016028 [Stipagrostis hirtigluma subsp. patula]
MAAARAYWDKDVTKIFLDLCIAEKEKMNFNYKKGLNKVGWNNVYRNFRQQTGRTYSSKQLQNKLEHNFAMEHNEHELGVRDMSRQDRYLRRAGQQIVPAQDWLVATANDDIRTVRDWIAAGLYGLA